MLPQLISGDFLGMWPGSDSLCCHRGPTRESRFTTRRRDFETLAGGIQGVEARVSHVL